MSPRPVFAGACLAFVLCCGSAALATGGTKVVDVRDSLLDLQRLQPSSSASSSSGGSAADALADQEPLVASANHEAPAATNPIVRMLAAGSAPLPQGRRRLDGEPVHESLLMPNLPETLMAAASRAGRNPSSANPFRSIVDAGSPAGLQDGSGRLLPQAALAAQMANNNYNRLAMASALKYQQAVSNKQRRQGLSGAMGGNRNNNNNNNHQLRQQAASGARQQQVAMRRQGGGGGGRAASRRALAQAAERDAGDPNEYDELNSRSGSDADEAGDEDGESASSNSRSSSAADEDDEDERESASERSPSRRTSSSGFEDLTEDELSGRDEEPAGRPGKQQRAQSNRRQGGAQGQAQLAARASTRNQARRGRSSSTSSGGGGDDNDEADEDGESTNQRQLRADPMDLRYSPAGLQRRSMGAGGGDENSAAVAVAAAAGKALELDDQGSSASHVLNSKTDLQAAAGHHHGHHGHYYQYVEVPKKKAWKFGFKRGNHKHEIMKHEKGHKHKFHTEFKWHAKEKCKKKSKCKSVGKMVWDYKHAKKHHP